jgi:hypothetical protein
MVIALVSALAAAVSAFAAVLAAIPPFAEYLRSCFSRRRRHRRLAPVRARSRPQQQAAARPAQRYTAMGGQAFIGCVRDGGSTVSAARTWSKSSLSSAQNGNCVEVAS